MKKDIVVKSWVVSCYIKQNKNRTPLSYGIIRIHKALETENAVKVYGMVRGVWPTLNKYFEPGEEVQVLHNTGSIDKVTRSEEGDLAVCNHEQSIGTLLCTGFITDIGQDGIFEVAASGPVINPETGMEFDISEIIKTGS